MFDWGGYLTLAESLASSTDEASLRSAMSRAYYAVYRTAYNCFPDATTAERADSHTHFWNQLINKGRLARGVAQRGKRLLQARHDSDYQDVFPGDVPETTAGSLEDARKAMADLASVQQAQARTGRS